MRSTMGKRAPWGRKRTRRAPEPDILATSRGYGEERGLGNESRESGFKMKKIIRGFRKCLRGKLPEGGGVNPVCCRRARSSDHRTLNAPDHFLESTSLVSLRPYNADRKTEWGEKARS